MKPNQPGSGFRLPGLLGQGVVMVVAMFLTVLVVWIMVTATRAVARAPTADEMLLESFELLIGGLLVGTLALVLVGVTLRTFVSDRYGAEPFGHHLLHEVYDRRGLAVYSIETPEEHIANPYAGLSDVELVDVIDRIDAEAHPERWNAVLHEVKFRVEQHEPVRIG